MKSLSIYCSTLTMSVALYKGQILLDIQKKRIAKNKIDYLPLIVEKILTSNNIKSLDRILFCRGPGSYTANRSVKALAQGLSLAKNSKLVTLDNFEIYLSNLKNKHYYMTYYIELLCNNFHYQSVKTITDWLYPCSRHLLKNIFLSQYSHIFFGVC